MVNTGWVDEDLFKKFRELMPLASVDILAVHEDRLLLMLRNKEPGKDLWFVPGGRIRYGETLRQAAARKLREETGLSASMLEKKGVMCHFWPESHYVSTFFLAYVTNDKITPNEEHRDYKWVSEVTDDLHPYVKHMIKEAGIFTRASALNRFP